MVTFTRHGCFQTKPLLYSPVIVCAVLRTTIGVVD